MEIFFILSGYVLGPQLHKIFKYPTYLNLKVFYLRRWMRTIPIYLIIMLSIAIITPNISFNNIIGYFFFTKTWIKIPENNEFYTSMEPCHRRMVLFNFSINTNYLFLF